MGDKDLSRPLVGMLCALAFVTMLTYALASGAGQSLFISAYGSTQLPKVWLAVAVGSALVTLVLTRASQNMDIMTLFGRSCFLSAVSLAVLLCAYGAHVPYTPYALYVWKDLYIIVLVELFWTFANVAFELRTAPKSYGLFCAAGSIGSVAGNLTVGPLARVVGTAYSMWAIIPMLAFLGVACRHLTRHAKKAPTGHVHAATFKERIALLKNSPYLVWMAAMVALAQVIFTLTEFRFSRAIEVAYALESDRTELIGRVSAITNTLSFVVQIATSHILGAFGVQRALLILPWVIGATFVGSFIRPGIWATAVCQVTGKTFDYSLFRAAKEMLYIPLSYAEKTQGKAFVDILTYRVARGGVSMLLLALGTQVRVDRILSGLSFGLTLLWITCIVIIVRRYRQVNLKAAAGAAASQA